jgi:hypothetical protein
MTALLPVKAGGCGHTLRKAGGRKQSGGIDGFFEVPESYSAPSVAFTQTL